MAFSALAPSRFPESWFPILSFWSNWGLVPRLFRKLKQRCHEPSALASASSRDVLIYDK
jgi:hypothetical protein